MLLIQLCHLQSNPSKKAGFGYGTCKHRDRLNRLFSFRQELDPQLSAISESPEALCCIAAHLSSAIEAETHYFIEINPLVKISQRLY